MPYCPCCNIGIDYHQMKANHCNNCGHDWEIYHVMPVNDVKKHSKSYQCSCEPEIKYEGENMIIVHNSWDGREGVEWFYDTLK